MNAVILNLVVIGQIAVFQFFSVAFVRSLFAAQLGTPAEPLGGTLAAYLRRARRYRFGLGLVLLVLALACFFGFPPDPQARKILLAVVSLVSSAAFAYASVSDRRAVRTMRNALPDGGVRRASLEPRSASHWYHPAWEVVPIAVLVTTVVLTVALGRRLGHPTTEMWVLQVLQAAFVIGALLYTSRHGVAVPNVSGRLAVLRDHPEVALEFGERLASREMRYFMAAKIGVALLLGVSTIEAGLEALGHGMATWFGTASWVAVGGLLVLFAAFVVQIVTLTKHMQSQIEQPRHEVNERG